MESILPPKKSLITLKKSNVSYQQHLANFAKAFDVLVHRQSQYTVFDDFLSFALLMLKLEKKAEYFADLETRWKTPDEYRAFSEMLLHYCYASRGEDGMGFVDPLGDFFMERMSNDRNGQFFTPMEVCLLMAQIQGNFQDGQTVNDCSCGSGRNLLAAGRFNRNLIFFGEDIDLRCCKMTLLNMLSNSMQGRVAHKNTLSMQTWKTWEIVLVNTNRGLLPHYYEL